LQTPPFRLSTSSISGSLRPFTGLIQPWVFAWAVEKCGEYQPLYGDSHCDDTQQISNPTRSAGQLLRNLQSDQRLRLSLRQTPEAPATENGTDLSIHRKLAIGRTDPIWHGRHSNGSCYRSGGNARLLPRE